MLSSLVVVLVAASFAAVGALNVDFYTGKIKDGQILLDEDHQQTLQVLFRWPFNSTQTYSTYPDLISDNPEVLEVRSWNCTPYNETLWNGTARLFGSFLGRGRLYVPHEPEGDVLHVRVLPKQRRLTMIFGISVGVLLFINYINMGCAIDWSVVMTVVKMPIGPTVGLFCQYILMPLISYGVARLCFNDYVLQLGLFMFGCSPGGGASNMWTVLLEGNLNLSITMTFVSTVASLGLMPFWLFVLGRSLYAGTPTNVPYVKIFSTLAVLVIPVGIGLAMQKWLPRVARMSKKFLGPFCIAMILYIIVFGVYANLYMFRLISWEIIGAATLSVWVGFAVSACVAWAMRLPFADVIAIMVEAGVQNTGVAYVLLMSALVSPDSDRAIIVPVSASIVTPIPLTIFYLSLKAYRKWWSPKEIHKTDESNSILGSSSTGPAEKYNNDKI